MLLFEYLYLFKILLDLNTFDFWINFISICWSIKKYQILYFLFFIFKCFYQMIIVKQSLIFEYSLKNKEHYLNTNLFTTTKWYFFEFWQGEECILRHISQIFKSLKFDPFMVRQILVRESSLINRKFEPFWTYSLLN